MADGDPSGAGGEGGQDLCTFFASFINQRQRVEQLLNWLRESQTACTDTNCFDDINGLPGSELGPSALAGDQGDYYQEGSDFEGGPFAIVLCVVFALLTMYAMGLNSNRRAEEAALPRKSGGPGAGGSGAGNNTDDHGSFRRGNNHDDDHSRPAI